MYWILLLALLAGCGGPTDTPAEPMRRPSGVLKPPEDGSGVAVTSEAGGEMEVRVDIALPRTADKGTIAFIGVAGDRKTEDWMAGGGKPDFFWISPVVEFGESISLRAPLPAGLHFMAVVNQGGGDDLPGPGDLHSDPTPWSGEGELVVHVDRRYGEARARTVGTGAVQDTYDADGPRFPLVLRLGPDLSKPRGATRVILLGRDRRSGQPGGPPAFFWRTESVEATWPLSIDAPLPDGLHLEVVVDVDGDGMPSPGDLLSAPQAEFRPPDTGDSVDVLLDRRFAMPGAG